MSEVQAPEGYMKNASGHLVPIDNIKPIDLLRDETVREIHRLALALQKHIEEEKAYIYKHIQDFLAVSMQEYGVEHGGKKGNITLPSYDGNIKVQVAVSDILGFTEQIHAAKELVDRCVIRWSEGSNMHIKTLVQHAFQVDKEGNINKGRVLGLLQVDIDDDQWQLAMKALRDSIVTISSKQYIRIMKRENLNEKHRQVVLDFSSL